MRWRSLMREAWATTWAAKVSSILIMVVVAAMCFAAIVTVGRSASAAADVAARMEQAGARRLSVVDTRQAGFVNARTLDVVRGVSTVEAAVVLGMPFDAVNGVIGRGGVRVPVWPVVGGVDAAVTIVRGRTPQPGEALVSASRLRALGLEEPAGFLATADGMEQFPIVGAFRAAPPFDDLDAGAVVAATATDGRELRVVIDDVTSAGPTVSAILSILAPADIQDAQVNSPTALAETARDLNAQMSGFGRTLLLLILTVGGFFVAAVVLADVLIRRRDLGRRRTLGITRTDLVALVTARTMITAVAGAVIGCAAAWGTNLATGYLTPADFTIAVGVLAVLVGSVAALPPAAYASRLDPVHVMRTP